LGGYSVWLDTTNEWSWLIKTKPEPGVISGTRTRFKTDRNQTWPSSGTEIRIFENNYFCEKNSLEPGINLLLTSGFRLELPRKPEPGLISRIKIWISFSRTGTGVPFFGNQNHFFFFFLEPKPQVLHKSQELPNTGSNPIKSIIRTYYCIKFFFVLTSWSWTQLQIHSNCSCKILDIGEEEEEEEEEEHTTFSLPQT
jgi:hypothetical protein